MRYFAILLILVGFAGFSQIAYPELDGSILEPFEKNNLAIIGTVIQVDTIPSENRTQYNIQVKEYLKGQKSFDMITAILEETRPMDFPTDPLDYYNKPYFENENQVFVYLKEIGGKYIMSPFSFTIKKPMVAGPPTVIHSTGPQGHFFTQGDEIVISGMVKKGYLYELEQSNLDSSFYLVVQNEEEEQVESKKLTISPDGSYRFSFQDKGNLRPPGNYSWQIIYENGNMGGEFVIVVDPELWPPLKQFKSGISIDEIQCKESLVLVNKHDGSPACVKPESVPKLLERGWTFKNNQKIIHNETIHWKKYITISASRINESSLHDMLKVYHINEIPQNLILNQLFDGADGCKNETEVCALSRGISLERTNPFGIQVSDHDRYTITLDEEQSDLLFSQLEWTIEGIWIYTIIESQEKFYLLMLSTFDNLRTPDVKMKLIGTSPNPVSLKRGDILNYTIQLDTWAIYGSSAQIDLRAIQDAKDSGLNVWIEPDVLEILERSNATATLFIQSSDYVKDGIYDVRVIGRANDRLADLYCRNTVCPVVKIGDSNWSIRTFGSDTGIGIGGGKPPENTWVEIELNKNELFTDDLLEIKTFFINNGTEPIVLDNPRVLIKVIKADSSGYYEHYYGIDAIYVSDEPIVLEAKSKTLLVRPFYWDQMILQGDEEHRIDPSQRKITMYFTEGPYSWNNDIWFEIK